MAFAASSEITWVMGFLGDLGVGLFLGALSVPLRSLSLPPPVPQSVDYDS